MPDEKDLFDDNMSRLLRGAEEPPKMDPRRKGRILGELESVLRREARGGWRRLLTRRWIVGASCAAAAAAILVAVLAGTGRQAPERSLEDIAQRDTATPERQPPRPADVAPADLRTEPSTKPNVKPKGPAQVPAPREAPAPTPGSPRLADGTLVYPRSGSRYGVVGERHVRLESGELFLFVARSERPFVVETSRARAEARGTTFTVRARDDETFVAVGQGRVELRSAAGAVTVGAGEQASAAGMRPPERGPAPRFSHLVNWARQDLEGEKLFPPEEEHATGELVAVDPWGQEVRLELRRYHIDVVVENGIARTTVDQTFFNRLSWQIEGTFYFPLPPDASLSRLAMYVNGELNEGGMVERQYGRHVYESIVYRRRDPALLEMMEGNVFKMRVFPIFGRREKRIVLSYTQTLPELYGTLRYWFPMEHTNSKAKRLSIRVRVAGGAGKAAALSSTHAIRTRSDGGDLVVEYDAENVAPDQDLLLHLQGSARGADGGPRGGTGTDGGWMAPVASYEQDGRRYLFLRFRPNLAGSVDIRPRQWFIVNDVSASRSSADVKAQAYVIERLLAEADDRDEFALVNLDTEARAWKTGLASVRDEESASAAVKFASPEERLGATNIGAALRAVSELMKRAGAANPHVVYLGDGVATDGETLTERLVARLPKGAVFVGLGVGKKVDARFLQAAADATGGMSAALNPSEDLRWRVFDLVAAMNTPRLVDIETAFTDAAGRPVAVEAYPSAGTLSGGEALTVLARVTGTGRALPARVRLTGRLTGTIPGRVGSERFAQEYDLAAGAPEAAFAPRLWAAARIGHLLKESAAEYKEEIVRLSKEFYVVTPFTSLLVLEKEADYRKWKVEMGRKDHWRLYPAPKKIEVVHEPLKAPLARDPWGRTLPKPAPVVSSSSGGTPGHPKTIDEIVDSVQFRVHVPFYGHYPHQRRRYERFGLHELLAGRLPVGGYAAGHGMIAPILETENDMTDGGGGGVLVRTMAGQTPAGIRFRAINGLSAGRMVTRYDAFSLAGSARRGGGASVPLALPSWPAGSIRTRVASGASGMSFTMNRIIGPGLRVGDVNGLVGWWHLDESAGASLRYPVPPGARYIHEVFASTDGEPLALPGTVTRTIVPVTALRTSGEALPPTWIAARDKKIRAPPMISTSPSAPAMSPGEARLLGRAAYRRWREDRDRIRAFNRRYGGWYGGGGWDADWADERERDEAGAFLAGYDGVLRVYWDPDVGRALETRPGLSVIGGASAGPPPIVGQSYARAMGTVPGTLATLAADRVLPLREKLRDLAPGPGKKIQRDRALAAIDKLLKRLPELSAATERTGVFWSWQGWNVAPARWQFVRPVSQAWPGSRLLTDLTQHAPGLESTWADVTDIVLEAFGRPPRGKVDPAAAKRIAAARRNVPTMRVEYVTKTGDTKADKKGKVVFAFTAGRGDRFAWTRRTSMYLREDFVCDGRERFHLYPELGLAAKRPAPGHRLAELRALVPHLLPPAEELARAFDVKLEGTRMWLTTIRLTPIVAEGQAPSKVRPALTGVAARKGEEAERMRKLACLVTFDDRGLLHGLVWTEDGRTRLTCKYAYRGEEVAVTWTAPPARLSAAAQAGEADEKTGVRKLAEYGYRCRGVKPGDKLPADPFAPRLDGVVVIDMPLRRPAHYEALLGEVRTGAAGRDERVRLRRHLALAQIQEHAWQNPWGGAGPAYKTMQELLKDRAVAGRTELAPGDAAIVFAAGHGSVPRSIGGGRLREPSGHALFGYWRSRHNTAVLTGLAKENPRTFVGHLSAYGLTWRTGGAPAVEKLIEEYPRSPLLYAAAVYRGRTEDVWLALAELPGWRSVALSMAAERKPTERTARAFEEYHREMTAKGRGVPLSDGVVRALKQRNERWQRVIKRAFDVAIKSKDPGALLRFAELAWSHERELATQAIEAARGIVEEKAPLTWKLALAQSLWAMGRKENAWKRYEEISAALGKAGLERSPAFLATMARLAQGTRRHDLAVELELEAIEKERPHMPGRINVQLFRSRYGWLWGQLVARVRKSAAAVKAAPGAAPRAKLKKAMATAEEVWRNWRRVDAGHATHLYQQMATVRRLGGDEVGAWRIVSSLIDEKPRDGSSYFQVGAWFVANKDRDRGERFYAKAYEVEPTNAGWIWYRAELLRQMGRKEEARRLYQEILRKDWQPRFQHYKQKAKKRLADL